MGNLKKVKFKKEVIEYIRNNEGDDGWVDVEMFDAYNSYTMKFDVPFFIVDSTCAIIEPAYLDEWCVSRNHIEPYHDFEIKLDDGLFEI